ncbi:MAG: hypothetical protein J1E40_13285, partial [Oscillospiraceae bacterium]|nr:hypothetical protein [Oscillospiraceae bacterium]
YNENPTKQDSWDVVKSWTIRDASTGTIVTRYMLVPSYNYDEDKINQIIDEDKGSNNTYKQYTPYDSVPNISSDEMVIFYSKKGVTMCMVVPANSTMSEIIKANDAIKADTGVYEYNVMYSSKPTEVGENEDYISGYIDNMYVYVLYNKSAYKNAADAFNASNSRRADGVK